MKADNDGSASNEQKEEEKELLTLDEWKKLRGQREKPQYNLRKAGEGEDLSQWKNMRELQKEKQTEFLENGYNSGNTPKKNDSEKVVFEFSSISGFVRGRVGVWKSRMFWKAGTTKYIRPGKLS